LVYWTTFWLSIPKGRPKFSLQCLHMLAIFEECLRISEGATFGFNWQFTKHITQIWILGHILKTIGFTKSKSLIWTHSQRSFGDPVEFKECLYEQLLRQDFPQTLTKSFHFIKLQQIDEEELEKGITSLQSWMAILN
jgi:hypothetical protein